MARRLPPGRLRLDDAGSPSLRRGRRRQQATAAKGEAALAHGAQGFVELLREVDRFDLARLREGPLSDLARGLSPRINR